MPNGQDQESDKLLGDVAAGSRAAFKLFYEHHSSLVFGVLLRITRDRSLAEDLLQEVFVKVWRYAPSFDASKAKASTWLISIARNTAIDNIRKQSRRPQTDLIDERNGGTTTSSEDIALNADLGRNLAHCLSLLDDKHSWAVRKAYLDGYSYQELSDALGTPLNTVRSWLRRSLKRLRDCMDTKE
ncbi:hypothetical protein BVC71_12515 [Marivivens niveibacter]|uniref:RNA polymerase sigma factor n=1 Tax=Marivivens niveibacter TaxID=1930667 RepID=A0A251WX75_9RHOB|nr:sigma-70 family RNA polymerase sigma factor [Marivivens niveibacter]OUD08745.1 hypothetical protein BVC71_12515 [Marivivens niveibacter]